MQEEEETVVSSGIGGVEVGERNQLGPGKPQDGKEVERMDVSRGSPPPPLLSPGEEEVITGDLPDTRTSSSRPPVLDSPIDGGGGDQQPPMLQREVDDLTESITRAKLLSFPPSPPVDAPPSLIPRVIIKIGKELCTMGPAVPASTGTKGGVTENRVGSRRRGGPKQQQQKASSGGSVVGATTGGPGPPQLKPIKLKLSRKKEGFVLQSPSNLPLPPPPIENVR